MDIKETAIKLFEGYKAKENGLVHFDTPITESLDKKERTLIDLNAGKRPGESVEGYDTEAVIVKATKNELIVGWRGMFQVLSKTKNQGFFFTLDNESLKAMAKLGK